MWPSLRGRRDSGPHSGSAILPGGPSESPSPLTRTAPFDKGAFSSPIHKIAILYTIRPL